MNDDLPLTIIDDDEEDASLTTLTPWTIAIIDDEPTVHQVTTLALSNTKILDRPLAFIHAYSAEEGFTLIEEHPETAVLLLDVVMEDDSAGLRLAQDIREVIGRKNLQIVLRTGQPGYAPEMEVVEKYEINAYKTKNELTKSRLFTTVAAAIRSFSHLQALEASKEGLRAVVAASSSLMQERSITDYAKGVLAQIQSLFQLSANGIVCLSRRPLDGPSSMRVSYDNEYQVVAATGPYESYFGKTLDSLPNAEISVAISQALQAKDTVHTQAYTALYITTPSIWDGVILLDETEDVQAVDRELLNVFCLNISLGIENAKFFSHLNQAAYVDELTGLYSRQGLIEQSHRFIGLHDHNYELFLADIDYFHNIIEGLGYNYGSEVLRNFAEMLRGNFAKDGLLARVHSDVFAILTPAGKISPDEVAKLCSRPLKVEKGSIRLGVTVGSALGEKQKSISESVESALRLAQVALKDGKSHRRGRGQSFDENFTKDISTHVSLLTDIRRALEHEEFFFHLQPKVDVKTSKITGFEALIRWEHRSRGMIPPFSFIPIIEQSGLYIDLDLYVFRKVCELLKAHPEITVPIALNISANSLHHNDFLDELNTLRHSLAPNLDLIQLEITENALVSSEQAINHLQTLKNMGFTLCLDDFGAGYSSLSYLLRLPLDVIKIDRSFVGEITEDSGMLVVLKGIVEIGQQLNKALVVEGVETAEQLIVIAGLGVETVQGYYFYKPLPVTDAIALLQDYAVGAG